VAERLEMVVGGQRQGAMPATPDFAARFSPSSGFLVEGHRQASTFELPDHWIPFYMVGVEFVRGKLARYFLENGKICEEPIENGACFVAGPREIRRFRMEGAGGVCLVSIEPQVLQEAVAGSPARSRLELLRKWNGHDPDLKDLILRLRTEVTAGCPAGCGFR